MRRGSSLNLAVVSLLLAVLVVAESGAGARAQRSLHGDRPSLGRSPPESLQGARSPAVPSILQGPTAEPTPSGDAGELTLAFAGDVHFEAGLADLPSKPQSTLGKMSRHLRGADLAMVNLESALVSEGERSAKELEEPDERYWFSTPPDALDLFARSGVDVVSVANNHGADFGAAGLRQTLAAAESATVAVVGPGADAQAAFEPHRATIKGTDVSVLAADAVRRESDDPVWAAGEGGPGIAAARGKRPRRLLAAVEEAHARGDLVVVYLHWGRALAQCPTQQQRRLARHLAEAGADVVVGAHAHVLLGAGMLDHTYVSYGLGNFAWYHGARSRTGVLQVRVRDGRVVADRFVPARIPREGGLPQPLREPRRSADRAAWGLLRGCTDLKPLAGRWSLHDGSGDGREPGGRDGLPPYDAQVRTISPALRQRMIGSSHDPGRCPVALADLRHLTMAYVGFDGGRHIGEMVVHADHAEDVLAIFERLYDARWPIQRMRLVSEYGGDDNRSMAANNTSAYNCRPVAGQERWSRHAFGAAIDLNPVQNPYLTAGGVLPAQGRRFVDVDRSVGAEAGQGVIQQGDVVVRAFREKGWTWGGTWSQPDYQHFAAG